MIYLQKLVFDVRPNYDSNSSYNHFHAVAAVAGLQ